MFPLAARGDAHASDTGSARTLAMVFLYFFGRKRRSAQPSVVLVPDTN